LRATHTMKLFTALRRIVLFGLVAATAVMSAQAQTTKPKRSDVGGERPRAILYVGNSFFYYNNSMHGHIASLARAADMKPGLRGVSATISAAGLDWHDMNSYFRPDGIGRYSFGPDNELIFSKPGSQFDTVIMMDCSQCPVHPKLGPVFHDTVASQSKIVRQHGARPALFMSWAYKDKPEMTAQLAEEYIRAGNANDALVIPVGIAFANAMSKRPDVELYASDKRHPTLAGTYLASCVVLAAVAKQTPVGNSYTAGLDAATATYLQNVAWQTVQDFYGAASTTK
jgi:hypothetical protein